MPKSGQVDYSLLWRVTMAAPYPAHSRNLHLQGRPDQLDSWATSSIDGSLVHMGLEVLG